MEANELRIGNLAYNLANGNKELCTVNSITELGIGYDSESREGNCIINNIEPIPLTEEWLLNFGFGHREFSFDKGSFYLTKRTGKKDEYLYQAHTNRFQVKHVHQLQNLYFALTGEELKH